MFDKNALWTVFTGEALDVLRQIDDECIDCVVTSIPYWHLRDYHVEGQLGLERTPQEFTARAVTIFQEIKRVLQPQGTVFLNVGDTYVHASGNQFRSSHRKTSINRTAGWKGEPLGGLHMKDVHASRLKPKDVTGMPWRLALALQDDGWWLRNEIIWQKPNAVPEPPRGRFAVDHETIFMLTKNKKYHFDVDAVREKTGQEASWDTWNAAKGSNNGADADRQGKGYRKRSTPLTHPLGRLRRTVWSIPSWAHPDSRHEKYGHFATFNPEIPRRCILAGCPEGGTVLDPFSGTATTGVIANYLNRKYVGIEINKIWAERSKYWLENGYLFLIDKRRSAYKNAVKSEVLGQLRLFG